MARQEPPRRPKYQTGDRYKYRMSLFAQRGSKNLEATITYAWCSMAHRSYGTERLGESSRIKPLSFDRQRYNGEHGAMLIILLLALPLVLGIGLRAWSFSFVFKSVADLVRGRKNRETASQDIKAGGDALIARSKDHAPEATRTFLFPIRLSLYLIWMACYLPASFLEKGLAIKLGRRFLARLPLPLEYPWYACWLALSFHYSRTGEPG